MISTCKYWGYRMYAAYDKRGLIYFKNFFVSLEKTCIVLGIISILGQLKKTMRLFQLLA